MEKNLQILCRRSQHFRQLLEHLAYRLTIVSVTHSYQHKGIQEVNLFLLINNSEQTSLRIKAK